MSRMLPLAALVLSAGALAACGGSDDASSGSPSSSSSAPAVKAADGDKLTADDFTVNAPAGWTENDGSAMPSVNFLALAVDDDDKDGFSDNVNVISDPTLTRVDDVDDLGTAMEKVLNGVAKDVKLREPIRVDGEDAAVATATFTSGSISYKTLQYAVRHDDDGFIVTFSFSNDVPLADQRKVAESVMASWSWAA